MQNVLIEKGLRPDHRAAAAAAYWQAFAQKLRYPLGPPDKGIRFILRVLDADHAISAISPDGRFLGLAGFKTPKGAFLGGDFDDLASIYGYLGAAFRAALVGVLERPNEPQTLLMDGIVVEETARGLGVGTALLQAVECHAAGLGLARVRLDVINTNPRARALYERRGFVAHSISRTGPLRHVFGFDRATTMYKAVAVF
ncbi:GNAT family N-acetyltransferase [Paracoccus sp. M683]|uniref:GNAT family N-acetyltransferase n=1 Tax=Paracoccus sp. M683 TaxID=2594268 RepID=UPI00117D14E2|nr:GNAT family N-acetyltransferase [Paracoccus sp. M683]TRW97529.1 GNAT family N-acetyltransferase [Paracoccus sp. M683]